MSTPFYVPLQSASLSHPHLYRLLALRPASQVPQCSCHCWRKLGKEEMRKWSKLYSNLINRYQSYFTGITKLCTQHYFRKAGKFIASRGRGVPSSIHVNPFSCALELCPHHLLQDPLPSVFPSLLYLQSLPLFPNLSSMDAQVVLIL